MEWTRSETIGLASISCVFCRGLGLRRGRSSEEMRPCTCVFRAIFRACHARYRHCIQKAGISSNLTLDRAEGPKGFRVWGRRNEEYIADFELVCKRSLSEAEYSLCYWHFVRGEDWKECTAKLGIDKGTFFHRVYTVQEKLGRIFRELTPYALFPLDEYFSGTMKTAAVAVMRPKIQQIVRDQPLIDQAVARTNVIEFSRATDKVARRFPCAKPGLKAA